MTISDRGAPAAAAAAADVASSDEPGRPDVGVEKRDGATTAKCDARCATSALRATQTLRKTYAQRSPVRAATKRRSRAFPPRRKTTHTEALYPSCTGFLSSSFLLSLSLLILPNRSLVLLQPCPFSLSSSAVFREPCSFCTTSQNNTANTSRLLSFTEKSLPYSLFVFSNFCHYQTFLLSSRLSSFFLSFSLSVARPWSFFFCGAIL